MKSMMLMEMASVVRTPFLSVEESSLGGVEILMAYWRYGVIVLRLWSVVNRENWFRFDKQMM